MGLLQLLGATNDLVRASIAAIQSPPPIIFQRNALDAFGRQRMSMPMSVFDSKLLYDNQPLLWGDVATGTGGTATSYNTNQASVSLSVNPTIAGKRIRQTFRSFPYQEGKSGNIMMTGIIGVPVANVTREIGYTDGNNGLLFQSQGSALNTPTSVYVNSVNVVRRSYTGGAVAVDTVVPQAQWNIDNLSGFGGTLNPSGIQADWSKVQIFGIDFQYLGVGSVFMYVVIGGAVINVHRFDQANVGLLTYMSVSNLPLRYSIESDGGGGVGAAQYLTHMCSAVQVEGGLDALGTPYAIERGITGLTTGADTNVYTLVTFRLRSGYTGSIVSLLGGWVATTSAGIPFRWAIMLNPTFGGVNPTYASLASSSSGIEYAAPANMATLTNGTILAAGVGSTTQPSVIPPLMSDWRPGTALGGTADQVALGVQNLTGAANTFFGGLNVREVY